MAEQSLDLADIRKLHQAGDLQTAKKHYLIFLKKHPTNVEALHWLAIVYTQQENFSEGLETIQKAIELEPHNPILQLHLANILKLQGLYSQAIEILQNTIQTNPSYIPALNNLGTMYYAQGKLTEAVPYFREAITKQPNYVDAYYNLALTLAKLDQFDEAIATYDILLKEAPTHIAARFQLACTLMQHGKIDEAINHFLKIEETHPFHFETQSNLATCYLKIGLLNEAKQHYLNALKLSPDDLQILYNLGVISSQQGFFDQAIQYYQRTVQIDPDHFAAHNNLGVAFLAKQHTSLALQHFEEALRLRPKNKTTQHIVNMLTQKQHLLTAPPDYITSLFDAYADHYDSHLLNALDYQVPTLLFNAIKKIKKHRENLSILDLGCGTGLCGQIFKPIAKTLVGVDLSSKMIEFAKQKNIYDELIVSDLTLFLKDKKDIYDLILAGDVFVYIGDLDEIFSYIHTALRKEGLLAFNTEINDKKDFTMNQSGRFTHHKEYLERLANRHGFQILSYEKVVTRLQNNEAVYGHLYVLGVGFK